MTIESGLLILAVAGLVGYLVAALIVPERFS